jgi:allantoicase
VIRLATKGTIRRIEIDTRHFKGNAPGACSLEGAVSSGDLLGDEQGSASQAGSIGLDSVEWRQLLPRTPLEAHARHVFEEAVRAIGDITYVRFNIYPDGGVGRLRLFGRPCGSKI